MVAVIIISVVILLYIIASAPPPFTIKSNWNHYFDDMQISSLELYPKIVTRLRDWKLELSISRITMKETHFFSASREYLRICSGELVFYFGVYEFGKGTYASWWLGINDESFLNRIPVISKLLGKDRKNKSFYQLDIETMYRSTIHSAILSVIEEFGQQKGARLLSPENKQIQ